LPNEIFEFSEVGVYIPLVELEAFLVSVDAVGQNVEFAINQL
jgi:hypothetical protein